MKFYADLLGAFSFQKAGGTLSVVINFRISGIMTTPGNGFGSPGEGYIRMTITTGKDRLSEAVDRIKKIGW